MSDFRNDLVIVNQVLNNKRLVRGGDEGAFINSYKSDINETLGKIGIDSSKIELPEGTNAENYRQLAVAAEFLKDRGASTYGLNSDQMTEIFQKIADPKVQVANVDELAFEAGVESGKLKEKQRDIFTQETLDFSNDYRDYDDFSPQASTQIWNQFIN
ncbi:MAG: hypothetical protein HRT47_09595 [Candidatus Caenarcaniphilales bacterium]|nr:hypothetical protein [Candidatus Caenarcaniphilales bacterium]